MWLGCTIVLEHLLGQPDASLMTTPISNDVGRFRISNVVSDVRQANQVLKGSCEVLVAGVKQESLSNCEQEAFNVRSELEPLVSFDPQRRRRPLKRDQHSLESVLPSRLAKRVHHQAGSQ